ncbi:Long chain acyl-CoA synthetase 5 [Tetrabaena socialis]|uniref:Long chain acyl-CoA synthetase 5 n=1 Tax=Tetrabaena socialis TaxID=47790 RepID=A0A2J7ZWI4_9CHLO|nr:Long chain acyl-CoA synthetase 5 [Tetrabaena socialis]|eukprot:PNH04612.1 Long chain acyl-CoA synthetase 5 [Tetrabaena socialis]
MATARPAFRLLAEVAPGRPATERRPEVGPTYRPAFHKHGFPKLEGIETCYDLFECGDVRKLMDDVTALKPTLFAGVPRVFERVYNGVRDKVAGGSMLSRMIFNWAFNRKAYYMKAGYKQSAASPISDLLVFNNIKQRLGGKVRVLVSGSAPLSQQIESYMRVVVGAPFVQGYGLTETCAASFIATPDNPDHVGSVGSPMAATEVRLEAVPELGYSPASTPPRGEVCVRGPSLFTGYYGNEALTKEAMDEDGFFHTGDVGELAADGTLRIVDRKKNIFKLSQGEYIAVEKIENVYKTCPRVEQVWVYGDSQQPCVVGIVVPAEKALMAWAAEAGVAGDYEAVCASPAACAAVLAAMTATGKAEKLNSLEQIKAVTLVPEQVGGGAMRVL